MNKIKVIHVVHDFLHGGIEAFVYYLVKAQLQNPDLDVSILCCQNENAISNRRITQLDIKITYLKISSFDFNISQYLKLLKTVNQYSIIHVHSFKPILAVALSFKKKKLLYTNHSAGIVGRKNDLSFKIKNYLLVRFLNNVADGISNNSSYTKTFWLNRGVTKRNNWVIYNGVYFNSEIDHNRPFEEYPILKDKFIVGTTSRFISWKRIELLIDAFFIFKESKPNAILLLVGDGPTRKELEKKVLDMGIDGEVIFTGFKNNVIDYQNIMNVCVFPSHSEPFGLVAVECLHLAKPVIVMEDGGGITEIIENLENQDVVRNIEDISDRINFYFNNQLPESAYDRIKFSNKFNMNIIEEKFYGKYKIMSN